MHFTLPICACGLRCFITARRMLHAVLARAFLSVHPSDTELSVGPIYLTQPNPTDQTIDPTQPNPSQSENFGPMIQPNPQPNRTPCNQTTNLQAHGRQCYFSVLFHT